MISFLRQWVEGIIICVFVSIIIEMLVPAGNIKKYVRVIIGVYTVFVILNPIISNLDNIDVESFFQEMSPATSEGAIVDNDEVQNIYVKAIEAEIEEKFNDIESATVTFTEDLKDIEKIEIVLLENTSNIKDIKEYLIDTYKITEDKISIIV